MSDEQKQSKPPGLDESADADTPQDPGIPGSKPPDEQPEREPQSPGQGFPESAEDERAKREAAEADDTLAPGSMPPRDDDPAR
ncbi:MAG TPA: hypothetical protein VH306_02320 [Gaiellaceae bacterium]